MRNSLLRSKWGRWLVIGGPYTWLLLMLMIPFLYLLNVSVSEMVQGGGYLPIYRDGGWHFKNNYAPILTDLIQGGPYRSAYLSSVFYAGLTAILCLLIGYPFAYFIARAEASVRPALLLMVMLPFWTSFLLRVYAWKGLLAEQGVINRFMMTLGIIDEPIRMLYTDISMLVGMTYVYLPFMILPLYANLVKHDLSLLEAASDLGSSNFNNFWKITVPLSKNGIIAGSMLVFIPVVGEFVIPELLGGPETLMIGKVLWQEFFNNRDWPVASALAVVMLAVLIIPIILFNRNQAKELEGKV